MSAAPASATLRRKLVDSRDASIAAAEKLAATADLDLESEVRFQEHIDDVARYDDLVDRVTPKVQVKSEPLTYQRHGDASFIADKVAVSSGTVDQAPRHRLDRHAAEMRVELAKRDKERRAAYDRAAAAGGWTTELRANMNRTATTGGEFSPPLWLMDLTAGIARAPRQVADLCRTIPLPGDVQIVNIPRVTAGGATAPQTADGAAVQKTDMVTSTVPCPVRTIAGAQVASLSLLEQSIPTAALDEIVFADLLDDYGSALASQIIAGTGSSGQLTGMLAVAGTNAVAYTDASPTAGELLGATGQAVSVAATLRKRPGGIVIMHPRRWAWIGSGVDTAGAPFLDVSADQLQVDEHGEIIGPAGVFATRPVYQDTSIPTNLGAGTNEDRIIVTRPADHVLLEGEPTFTVTTTATEADALSVRLQFRRYVAFTAARHPEATSIVAGTGLAAPAGY